MSTDKTLRHLAFAVQAMFLVLISLIVSGCAGLSLPTGMQVPENHPDFRNRLYAGAAMGSTALNPDTSGTIFEAGSNAALGTQIRLGIDIHNMLALELDTAVLGSTQLSSNLLADADLSIKYTAATVSALVYGLTGVQNRSRRESWSGYARFGFSLLQKSSGVLPLDESGAKPVLGLGLEYGFNNGLGIRGEITRYDQDAIFFGLGAVYRFGLSPAEIGNVFVSAAKPALGATNTRVGESGRGLRRTEATQPRANSFSGYGSAAMGARTWAPKSRRGDTDGDGVRNQQDECPNSATNTTVGSTGCGLLDAVLSDVTFKSGSYWLTPKARGELDALAVTLLAFPEVRIEVRAHSDNTGPADLNMNLSSRRAEAVVEYLQSLQVNELQLEARGMGESQPLDNNDTPAGKRRNRRVELVTLPNLQPGTWQGVTTLSVAAQGIATKDKKEATVGVVAQTKNSASRFKSEPVFPPMAGVKIEPLPKSAYVAGLSLAGVIKGVGFQPRSALLTNDAKQALQPIRDELIAYPAVRIVIMAHTDDQGSEEDNQALSVLRANAVVQYFVQLGVEKSRLTAEGYGESLPLVQNVSKADRQRNRRIELRVLAPAP